MTFNHWLGRERLAADLTCDRALGEHRWHDLESPWALAVHRDPPRGLARGDLPELPGRVLLREIATRYLPPEKVPAYIEFARADFGEQVAICLRPQRWLS